MSEQRIIFMGTPVFACGILQRLIDDGYHVVGVVSQPDKRVGRKQELQSTPVKQLAEKYQIPVLQPVHIKEEYEAVLDLKPDMIITCAYGQLIPQVILDTPKFGCINVHASLLPRLRGGAPIHKAIIYGEENSGVSIMQMVKKMDAGPVCSTVNVKIDDEDTMGSLHDKLMSAGAKCLSAILPKLFDGTAEFIEQDESQATFAWNISKEEELIQFDRPVKEVYNHMRGLIPAPVGYALINGKKMKFHQVAFEASQPKAKAGTILGFDDNSMMVAALDGIIHVLQLQVEGKGKTTAREFYNGAGRNYMGKEFES